MRNDAFSIGDLQTIKTFLVISKRKGLDIDQALAGVEERIEGSFKLPPPVSHPLDGTTCPSCGKGLVISKKREKVKYLVCKYKKSKVDEPQGCGWSRMVTK